MTVLPIVAGLRRPIEARDIASNCLTSIVGDAFKRAGMAMMDWAALAPASADAVEILSQVVSSIYHGRCSLKDAYPSTCRAILTVAVMSAMMMLQSTAFQFDDFTDTTQKKRSDAGVQYAEPPDCANL